MERERLVEGAGMRLTDPIDWADAARALSRGAVVGHAPPSRIAELFDWSELPTGLTRRSVLNVMDCFWGIGPFGFRGPAAAHVPEHLTSRDGAVRTTQVIAPGYACASNAFLARSLAATGDDLLFITSANRSRQLNGTDDSPPHWRASALAAEFGHEPDFALLRQADEDAVRAAYPRFLPMSTTILSFHRRGSEHDDTRPHLVLERHGSLDVHDVRHLLGHLGVGLSIGPRAGSRPRPREYADR